MIKIKYTYHSIEIYNYIYKNKINKTIKIRTEKSLSRQAFTIIEWERDSLKG